MAIRVRIVSVTDMTRSTTSVTAAVELFDPNDVTFVPVPNAISLAMQDLDGLSGAQARAKLLSAIDGWASDQKALIQATKRLDNAFVPLVGTDRPIA